VRGLAVWDVQVILSNLQTPCKHPANTLQTLCVSPIPPCALSRDARSRLAPLGYSPFIDPPADADALLA
jgi:hypothetical protein